MTKTQKAEMYRQIEIHGNNLLRLFPYAIIQDPIKLSKRLHSLENKAHKLAEDYCNGVIDIDKWELLTSNILDSVNKLLGSFECKQYGLFVNGDPRGYALKLGKFDRSIHGLTNDWGGYGILSPDFNP